MFLCVQGCRVHRDVSDQYAAHLGPTTLTQDIDLYHKIERSVFGESPTPPFARPASDNTSISGFTKEERFHAGSTVVLTHVFYLDPTIGFPYLSLKIEIPTEDGRMRATAKPEFVESMKNVTMLPLPDEQLSR